MITRSDIHIDGEGQMSRSADSRTKSVKLFADEVDGSGPRERFAVFVVVGEN